MEVSTGLEPAFRLIRDSRTGGFAPCVRIILGIAPQPIPGTSRSMVSSSSSASIHRAFALQREGPVAVPLSHPRLPRFRHLVYPWRGGPLSPACEEVGFVDNRQASSWLRRTAGFRHLPISDGDEHFD